MRRFSIFLIVLCFFANQITASALGTSAKGAILINADTCEVIYEQNADSKLPMASTTKIMTGLLLCEYGNFDKEITVTAEMLRVEGSSMGLLAGDKVTLHDLLYGLMLASGNDAANVIAYTLGGTINGFVNKMNSKAEELGLKNTHFETPSGLDGESHYTSARDLATLAAVAMKNEEFAKAVSAKSATLCYGNPPYKRTLTNHNKLLKTYEEAVGIKTGFTKKSGRCLVSAAKKDGKFVIAVTLNDPDDWKDHKNLLEYGLNAVIITEVKPQQNEYSIPVIGADTDSILLKVEPKAFSSLGDGEIHCEVKLPRFVYAPIEENEQIGTVVYSKNNKVIEEVALRSREKIESQVMKPNILEEFLENFKYIFNNLWEK